MGSHGETDEITVSERLFVVLLGDVGQLEVARRIHIELFSTGPFGGEAGAVVGTRLPRPVDLGGAETEPVFIGILANVHLDFEDELLVPKDRECLVHVHHEGAVVVVHCCDAHEPPVPRWVEQRDVLDVLRTDVAIEPEGDRVDHDALDLVGLEHHVQHVVVGGSRQEDACQGHSLSHGDREVPVVNGLRGRVVGLALGGGHFIEDFLTPRKGEDSEEETRNAKPVLHGFFPFLSVFTPTL